MKIQEEKERWKRNRNTKKRKKNELYIRKVLRKLI